MKVHKKLDIQIMWKKSHEKIMQEIENATEKNSSTSRSQE
jgi:hypothetical protein